MPVGLLVGRHEVLAGDAREVHAHPLVLEVVRGDVVRADLGHAPQLTAFAALVHHRERRALRHRRAIKRGRDHRQPAGGLVGEAAIAFCVFLRELRDLGAGALAVAIQGEGAAILEHRHHRHLGEGVFQAVLALEPEPVAGEQRVGLDEDVRHRVLVVAEPRHRDLAGDAPAAPATRCAPAQ